MNYKGFQLNVRQANPTEMRNYLATAIQDGSPKAVFIITCKSTDQVPPKLSHHTKPCEAVELDNFVRYAVFVNNPKGSQFTTAKEAKQQAIDSLKRSIDLHLTRFHK